MTKERVRRPSGELRRFAGRGRREAALMGAREVSHGALRVQRHRKVRTGVKELAFGFGLKTKTGALGLILDVEAIGTFAGVNAAAGVAVAGGWAEAMTGVEPAEAGTLGRNGGISAIRAAVGDERVEAALATGVACE